VNSLELDQMGTQSCTVFLFRFSLNTLYIRLVFIKTQNLPVGILGMNFVFSSNNCIPAGLEYYVPGAKHVLK
jgi:hypothetical protein